MFIHVSIKKMKDLCKPSAPPGGRAGCPAPVSTGSHHGAGAGTLAWVSLRRCGRGRVLVTGVQVGIMSKLLSTGFLWKITVLHLCIKLF